MPIGGGTPTEGFETISFSFHLSKDELPLFDDQRWVEEVATQMGKPLIDGQYKLLFRRLDQVTAEVGNVIDAKGQPFSEMHILEMLERVDLDFNADGSPRFPTMLVGKAIYDKLASLEPSDEFKARFEELIERKRTDWRLSEADRKLVD